MDNWKLVGRRVFEKKDTHEICGLFFVQRSNPDVEGIECDIVYANGKTYASLPDLKIGDNCLVIYNKSGFLDTIIPVPGK